MSAVYKNKGLAVSTQYVPSTVLATSQVIPNGPVRVSSATLRQSNAHLGESLRDIKRRYEEEARNVQQNYQADYQNYASLVKAVEELEISLEEERRRSLDFENRYNGVVIELEKERRLRVDYEHESGVLREELRRAEAIISDSELKISRFHQDMTHIDSENKSLRNEIHRLTDVYNSKVREIEERYLIQIRDLSTEIERLRSHGENVRVGGDNRFRDLDRDTGLKITRLEERIKDKDRLIAELEAELRKVTDHISHLKIEYEEELRRQVLFVREEEQHNNHVTLKTFEGKLQQLENERELLVRKSQDLIRDVHLRERQIQDLRIQFEAEVARLRNETNDLRNQINVLNANNDKLRNEVTIRDTSIGRLESEINNLEREIERVKTLHNHEINRLVNDQANEMRRWEEDDRLLKSRIAELERIIKSFEAENDRLKADLERLKAQITGNVHRTIFQTFVEYEAAQNKKPLF